MRVSLSDNRGLMLQPDKRKSGNLKQASLKQPGVVVILAIWGHCFFDLRGNMRNTKTQNHVLIDIGIIA